MSNYYLPLGKDSCLISHPFTEDVNKSIKLTHRILITSVCLSEYVLALGCNTGNIYLFHISDNYFKYGTSIFNSDSPILGIEFSPTKDFLAYFNKNCQVFIIKLCFDNEMKSKIVRQVDASSEFQIKQLLWTEDSTKLFYGCDDGRVDLIHVPQNTKDYLYIPTERLVKMPNQVIVQLDLNKDYLLISSNIKVVMFDLSTKTSKNIGSKPRNGSYGACFWFNEKGELKILAARPNYRIWIASLKGDVEETQQYKNWDKTIVYNINKPDCSTKGSGQFYFLLQLKSGLVLAVDQSHLVLLLDLQKRCCLTTLDCGLSYLSFIRNTGFVNVNENKNIIFISHHSIRDGISMLFNEANYRKAIDLFLEFQIDSPNQSDQTDNSEDSGSNQIQNSDEDSKLLTHMVLKNLESHLLTQLVQMSAEMGYRFAETNFLQVELRQAIDDNNKVESDINLSLATSRITRDNAVDNASTSQLDRNLETSISAKGSSRSSLTKQAIASTFNNTATNLSTNFLKSVYKTSEMLTNNYLINTNVNTSEYTDRYIDSYNHNRDDYHNDPDEEPVQQEDLNPPEIKTMELESEIYIAWENFKKLELFRKSSVALSSTEHKELEDTFLSSLSIMCKTWLNLIIQYWLDLFNYEIRILNLSGTFSRNIPLSWSNMDLEPTVPDASHHPVTNQNQSYQANSWSNTIQQSNWLKSLPISEKLQKLLSDLLSYCAYYSIFDNFPSEIAMIRQLLTNKINSQSSLFSEIDDDWIDLQSHNLHSNFKFELNSTISTNQNESIQHIIDYFNDDLNKYIDYIDPQKIQEINDFGDKINEARHNDCDVDYLYDQLTRLYEEVKDRIEIIEKKLHNKRNKLIQTSCQHVIEYQDLSLNKSTSDNGETTNKLLDLLYSKVWSSHDKSKPEWIHVLLVNFDSSFNQIIIRKWLDSGITHDLWKIVLGSYNEVYSSILKSKLYRCLDQKTSVQLQDLLYESVYFEDMKDCVIGNHIIRELNNKQEPFPWKPIVKAGNLSLRSAMHFCLSYQLDFAEYLLNLFQLELPLVYRTRSHLLAHIYDKEDVLIAFIFSMLYKYRSDTQINLSQCKCGAVLSLDSITLPEDYQAITLELIQYGVKQGIFGDNERLRQIIMDICLQNGYSEGYIELVLCNSDWKKLVIVGFQLRNYVILRRLKDLNLSSHEVYSSVIHNIIETKRTFDPARCLQCSNVIPDDLVHSADVISWAQLGNLVFNELRTTQNFVGLTEFALGSLTNEEINSGVWRTNMTELIDEIVRPNSSQSEEDSGLLAQFIDFEMKEGDNGAKRLKSSLSSSPSVSLTEKYLDLYGSNRVDLCGHNWGRIFNPESSLCDLCSRRLFLYTSQPSESARQRRKSSTHQKNSNLEILAFACGHAFHEICLSAFYNLDHCIFC